MPQALALFQEDRKAGFAAFSSAVESYWHAVFEPVWSQVRAVLEREVIVCGRVLATEGGIAALSRIHPAFRTRRSERVIRELGLTYRSPF